jgi:hypothetical protein
VSRRPRLPPAHLTMEELHERWAAWTPLEREAYEYWLDLAKDCEEEPLQAACFAVRRMEEWRAKGVLGRSKGGGEAASVPRMGGAQGASPVRAGRGADVPAPAAQLSLWPGRRIA